MRREAQNIPESVRVSQSVIALSSAFVGCFFLYEMVDDT